MPELPEVETTRRGILPHILKQPIHKAIVRRKDLRWPIAEELKTLPGQHFQAINRRGRYLLLTTPTGTVIIHLGMSGCLRITTPETPPNKHDHVDIIFKNNQCLRYHDPRRFGCILWDCADGLSHQRLHTLGIEPLTQKFNASYLHKHTQQRTKSINPNIS